MAALGFDVSELRASARRRSAASETAVQEQVSWDLNSQPLTKRLAPFRFEFSGQPECFIEIVQAVAPTGEPGQPTQGTGSALWSAAIGTSRFFEAHFGGLPPPPSAAGAAGPQTPPLLDGRRVLELGCGTGLLSLLLGCMGATVAATDIDGCLDAHTRPNVEANLARLGDAVRGSVECRTLVWGETDLDTFGNEWDIVLASEVIYRAEHVPALLETLRGLLGPRSTGYIALENRGREGVAAFLAQVEAADWLTLRHVAHEEFPVGYRFAHLDLVELRTKPADGEPEPPSLPLPPLPGSGGGEPANAEAGGV